MPSVQDIMLLCRLCSVKDKVTVPIFGEDDANDIPLKISACLPVKVSLEDNLPKKICDTCLNKLESLYQFWNEAANTERKFLDWLSQDELIADDDSPDAESSEFDSMTIKREEELIDVPDVNFSDVKSLSADPIAITKQIEDLESTNSYEPPFKRSKTDDNVVPIQRAEDNKDISSLVITSTIDIDSETKTEKESENALDQSELQNFVPVDEELQPGTSGIVQPVNEETSALEHQLKKSVVVLGDLSEVDCKKYQFVNKTLDELKSASLAMIWCRKCDKEIFGSIAYMDHLFSEHEEERTNFCKFCDSTFNDKEDLENHVQDTHPHFCERCRRTFVSYHQALLHEKLHVFKDKQLKTYPAKKPSTQKQPKKSLQFKYKATQQQKSYPEKKPSTEKLSKKSPQFQPKVKIKVLNLLKNGISKINNKQKNYCCDECGSRFEDCYQLQRHNVVQHKKIPQKRYDMVAEYKCVLCSKHYSSERLLEEHKKIHLVEVKSVAISNKSNKASKVVNSQFACDENLEASSSQKGNRDFLENVENSELRLSEIDSQNLESEPIEIDDDISEADPLSICDEEIENQQRNEEISFSKVDILDNVDIICNDIEFSNDNEADERQMNQNSQALNIPMESPPVILNFKQTIPGSSLVANSIDLVKFKSMRVTLLKDKEAVSHFLSNFPPQSIKPSIGPISPQVNLGSSGVAQTLNNVDKTSSPKNVDVIEIDSSSEESETDEAREICALCSKSHRFEFLTNRSGIYVCIWCSYILCLASNKLRFFNKLKSPVMSRILSFVNETETTECNMCTLKQKKEAFTAPHSLAICNTCQTKISQLTGIMIRIGRKKGKRIDGDPEEPMVICEGCNIAKKLDSVARLDDIIVCNWCWPKLLQAASLLSTLCCKALDEAAGNNDVSKTRCHLCNMLKKVDNVSLHREKSICAECRTNMNKLAAFFSNVLRNLEVCNNCTKMQRNYILKKNSIFCSRCVLRRPNACAKCDAADRLGNCICETKQPLEIKIKECK